MQNMYSFIMCVCSITMIIKPTIAHNFSLSNLSRYVTTTTTEQSLVPLQADVPVKMQSNFSLEMESLDYDVFCKFQPNSHSCVEHNLAVAEYYYDVKMGDCRAFQYGGCLESKNVFHYLKACQRVCREAGVAVIDHYFNPVVFCRLQPDIGTCADYISMYYFDLSTHQCVGFAFTGCGGNQNRFENVRDCMRTCGPAVNYKHFHPYERKKI